MSQTLNAATPGSPADTAGPVHPVDTVGPVHSVDIAGQPADSGGPDHSANTEGVGSPSTAAIPGRLVHFNSTPEVYSQMDRNYPSHRELLDPSDSSIDELNTSAESDDFGTGGNTSVLGPLASPVFDTHDISEWSSWDKRHRRVETFDANGNPINREHLVIRDTYMSDRMRNLPEIHELIQKVNQIGEPIMKSVIKNQESAQFSYKKSEGGEFSLFNGRFPMPEKSIIGALSGTLIITGVGNKAHKSEHYTSHETIIPGAINAKVCKADREISFAISTFPMDDETDINCSPSFVNIRHSCANNENCEMFHLSEGQYDTPAILGTPSKADDCLFIKGTPIRGEVPTPDSNYKGSVAGSSQGGSVANSDLRAERRQEFDIERILRANGVEIPSDTPIEVLMFLVLFVTVEPLLPHEEITTDVRGNYWKHSSREQINDIKPPPGQETVYCQCGAETSKAIKDSYAKKYKAEDGSIVSAEELVKSTEARQSEEKTAEYEGRTAEYEGRIKGHSDTKFFTLVRDFGNEISCCCNFAFRFEKIMPDEDRQRLERQNRMASDYFEKNSITREAKIQELRIGEAIENYYKADPMSTDVIFGIIGFEGIDAEALCQEINAQLAPLVFKALKALKKHGVHGRSNSNVLGGKQIFTSTGMGTNRAIAAACGFIAPYYAIPADLIGQAIDLGIRLGNPSQPAALISLPNNEGSRNPIALFNIANFAPACDNGSMKFTKNQDGEGDKIEEQAVCGDDVYGEISKPLACLKDKGLNDCSALNFTRLATNVGGVPPGVELKISYLYPDGGRYPFMLPRSIPLSFCETIKDKLPSGSMMVGCICEGYRCPHGSFTLVNRRNPQDARFLEYAESIDLEVYSEASTAGSRLDADIAKAIEELEQTKSLKGFGHSHLKKIFNCGPPIDQILDLLKLKAQSVNIEIDSLDLYKYDPERFEGSTDEGDSEYYTDTTPQQPQEDRLLNSDEKARAERKNAVLERLSRKRKLMLDGVFDEKKESSQAGEGAGVVQIGGDGHGQQKRRILPEVSTAEEGYKKQKLESFSTGDADDGGSGGTGDGGKGGTGDGGMGGEGN